MAFRERTGVSEAAVRELVTAERFAVVLRHLDYQAYRAGVSFDLELAERGVGYLAAGVVDPGHDLETITFWVPRSLSDLLAAADEDPVENSYLQLMREAGTGIGSYALPPPKRERPVEGQDEAGTPTVRLRFDRTHGETLPVDAPYHSTPVRLPTAAAYREAAAAHGVAPGGESDR